MAKIGKWQKVSNSSENEEWVNSYSKAKMTIVSPENSQSGKWETISQHIRIVTHTKKQAMGNAYEIQKRYPYGVQSIKPK